MAFIGTVTGFPRISILAILPLFVVGLILMLRLPEQRSEIEEIKEV